MTVSQTDAPVFFTLVQVKFNAIEDVADYISSLLKKMRLKGYPDYSPETHMELQVRTDQAGDTEVKHVEHKRWLFNDIDRKSGFVLSKDQLVFQTTDYKGFEAFSRDFLDGLRLIMAEVEGLIYFDRIGLRYLDAVHEIDGANLSELLDSGLLGLNGKLRGEGKHCFTETVNAIDDGVLVTRSIVTDKGLIIPPDLEPLKLDVSETLKELSGINLAVLDFDFFVKKRGAFEIKNIEEQLVKSHAVIKEVFEIATTEKARSQVWTL